MEILDWVGDLGKKGQGSEQPDEWLYQYNKYQKYFRYYAGVVLNQKVESDSEADPPLLYPVKMNLVKLLCHTQADALWGEWEDRIFGVLAYPKEGDVPTDDIQALQRFIYNVLDDNDIAQKAWEIGLDQMRFGGGVVQIKRDPKKLSKVRIERVPVMGFWPVWSPDSYDELLEVWVVTQISAMASKRFFGTTTNRDFVRRVEHWTLESYENYVDDARIDRYSGKHKFGKVPFVYIPRLRSDSFYGEALTEDVMGPQDELNMRVADVGESVTYNSHPIRWGYNLPHDINNPTKFPFGPDQLWDLGKTLPGQEPPQLNLLEASTPVAQGTFEHLRFVHDWGRQAGYCPPVSFGEDEGSQRSGATLVLRMWPLTRSARRTRLYLRSGMLRLIDLIMRVSPDVPTKIRRTYDRVMLDIDFAPVLPRERAEMVNEVVMRQQTSEPSLSAEGAMEALGERDPQREKERIQQELEERQDRAPKMESEEPREEDRVAN